MSDKNKNLDRKIWVIDQTLREGMQFRGVVFSLKQRIKILEFQETLGVDVCQAGYPPAHPMEADIVSRVAAHAKKNNFKIRIAALGRAFIPDVKILCQTGIDDPHFHLHIKKTISREDLTRVFKELRAVIGIVRERLPKALVSLAMLDIGKTDITLLTTWVRTLGQEIDILSLPDTSGIMAPNQVYDRMQALILSPKARLSVHCHNDMGMASANSVMGILGGASVLEVSALGIGERNGIGDLYTTARHLQNQGMDLKIDTDNLVVFKRYYKYLDEIVREQTGSGLIQYSTPAFGEAVKTHVAGTHAGGEFGTMAEEKFYLNLLCGRHLVQKYLDMNTIPYGETQLSRITDAIKTQSITLGRCLMQDEIAAIAASLC